MLGTHVGADGPHAPGDLIGSGVVALPCRCPFRTEFPGAAKSRGNDLIRKAGCWPPWLLLFVWQSAGAGHLDMSGTP
jgi:hypothetical protein